MMKSVYTLVLFHKRNLNHVLVGAFPSSEEAHKIGKTICAEKPWYSIWSVTDTPYCPDIDPDRFI